MARVLTAGTGAVAGTAAVGAAAGSGAATSPGAVSVGAVPLAVSARGLVKQFGNRRGLDGVDLDVPQGAFLSIFGPNGAGKTTLLRMLALLSRPTRGDLSILGVDALEEPDRLRSRIGLISHKSMLYGDLTARENLRFFASLYGGEGGAGALVRVPHRSTLVSTSCCAWWSSITVATIARARSRAVCSSASPSPAPW